MKGVPLGPMLPMCLDNLLLNLDLKHLYPV
uniref:Uncharacterized protein n=1 Tax=Picea glauca TaxID=3330 RepID=A0A101M1G8_PICGL|nr:hypothetical protein ABT39_MTgene3858 [Picea glauca]QHR86127.1 hypothetical protein Q903MT_gene126 [Picea sitchensis]